jgi:sec-independent protein translocase protein TatB
MFDVGFWELCLVGVVALLVFGPERLPGMARNVGLWIGRLRHLMNTAREDFDRELRLQELRELQQSLQRPENNPLQQVVQEAKAGLSIAPETAKPTENSIAPPPSIPTPTASIPSEKV